MNKENDININNKEIGEDTTKHGEFISSFFNWKTIKEQKKIVDKLENITKKEEK